MLIKSYTTPSGKRKLIVQTVKRAYRDYDIDERKKYSFARYLENDVVMANDCSVVDIRWFYKSKADGNFYPCRYGIQLDIDLFRQEVLPDLVSFFSSYQGD